MSGDAYSRKRLDVRAVRTMIGPAMTDHDKIRFGAIEGAVRFGPYSTSRQA
jgi:hypothetical protein